jgi:heat shock protein 5
MVGESAKN